MQVGQTIEISGTYEIADLARFQYFHSQRRIWPFSLLILLGATIAFASIPLALLSDKSDWYRVFANSIPFLLLLAFWLSLLLLTPYWSARKQLASQQLLREPTRFSFSMDGVASRATSGSGQFEWGVVREIVETKSLYVIYHGWNIAMLIPKRFFESASVEAQWRELIERASGKSIRKPNPVGRFC